MSNDKYDAKLHQFAVDYFCKEFDMTVVRRAADNSMHHLLNIDSRVHCTIMNNCFAMGYSRPYGEFKYQPIHLTHIQHSALKAYTRLAADVQALEQRDQAAELTDSSNASALRDDKAAKLRQQNHDLRGMLNDLKREVNDIAAMMGARLESSELPACWKNIDLSPFYEITPVYQEAIMSRTQKESLALYGELSDLAVAVTSMQGLAEAGNLEELEQSSIQLYEAVEANTVNQFNQRAEEPTFTRSLSDLRADTDSLVAQTRALSDAFKRAPKHEEAKADAVSVETDEYEEQLDMFRGSLI